MKLDGTFRSLLCAGLLAALPASAADRTPAAAPALDLPAVPPAASTAATAAQTHAPEPAPAPPIPVAEISSRAEITVARLKNLVDHLVANAGLSEKEGKIAEVGARVWSDVSETQTLLQQGPRLSVVDDLETSWREGRIRLEAQSDALTQSAREADAAVDEVKRTRDLWTRTETAARESDAPDAVLTRIRDTEVEIEQTREVLLALRTRILSLQDQAARQLAVSEEALARLGQFRREAVEQIDVPSSPPLWEARMGGREREIVAGRLMRETVGEIHRSTDFLERRAPIFRFQILELLVLVLLFRLARDRAALWAQKEPKLREAMRPLERSYSAAFVLTLISSLWLHPGLPRVLVHATAVLSFVPVLRILNHLVHPGLIRFVYIFAGFFLVDRVRDFVSPTPLLEQFLLSLEMAIGAGLMLWSLRPARLRGVELTAEEAQGLGGLRWACRILGAIFGVSFVAATTGYVQLARLLASASLGSVYVGMALYAAAQASAGLVAFLLRVRPLSRLRTVQHHRNLIEQRIGVGIRWVAIGLWLFASARNLAFFGLSGDTPRQILTAELPLGGVALSLGDILALGLTIWFAFVLSRFVRFVLSEEVYPRVRLAHGAPYAISSLIHYLILLGAFLLVMAGMGLDLNRFSVLAGAFGVGIGFGLQTIVNNFVSGLILLFERPIQIGDTVQVGNVMGDVKRIGIRSSTIRTGAGAEVIVPNSSLISEQVTNWTLSDTTRRIELGVGVAYDSDPERVLELLRDVASKHSEVLEYPEPVALLVRFGGSSLDFELRAWVQDGTRWPIIKTEIAVAVYRTLQEAGIRLAYPHAEPPHPVKEEPT
jgi:small-conductance mechanosensitive channel